MSICTATTKANTPCNAQAMQGEQYCYRHNPNIPEADKIEASTNGGKKRQAMTNADPVTLRNIESIVYLIESNTNAVRSGAIDPKTSNAVVQNINTLLKVYELAVTDTRVRKLEEKAGLDSPGELIPLGYN